MLTWNKAAKKSAKKGNERESLEDELKMKEFESPYQKVLLNVMLTGDRWEATVRDTLKEYGLTEQQFNVLRILRGQKGKPMDLQMVQERMLHQMSNTTRIVEKLRLKGLVERTLSASNRRQVELSIAPAGERLLEQAAPDMEKMQERVAKELSPEEVETLHQLLERLRFSAEG